MTCQKLCMKRSATCDWSSSPAPQNVFNTLPTQHVIKAYGLFSSAADTPISVLRIVPHNQLSLSHCSVQSLRCQGAYITRSLDNRAHRFWTHVIAQERQ